MQGKCLIYYTISLTSTPNCKGQLTALKTIYSWAGEIEDLPDLRPTWVQSLAPHIDLWALPGMIPEYKAINKSWAAPDMSSPTEKERKKIVLEVVMPINHKLRYFKLSIMQWIFKRSGSRIHKISGHRCAYESTVVLIKYQNYFTHTSKRKPSATKFIYHLIIFIHFYTDDGTHYRYKILTLTIIYFIWNF